jgi:hypothetical protein
MALQYNQQNPDGSWSQVTQNDDGTYTNVPIPPSGYGAANIPTGGAPPPPGGDQTTYDTPNGPKTLAEIIAGLQGVGWNGDYNDIPSVIAAYNATASGTSGGGGDANSAQNLLDAIASGDQQRFDEAVKEYQQTSSTNLATSLLGTASQLQGPADYFKFNQYTSGGRDLWQQLFGSQPRADFSAPTGPITPMTLSTLMQSLGMLPATPAPTTVNPAAPAGSVPAVNNQNVPPTAPPPAVAPAAVQSTPTTPLSGVAASVGGVAPQAVQSAPITPVLPIPSPSPTAQPSQSSGWGPPAPAPAPTPAPPPAPAAAPTDPTAAQKTPATIPTAWQNAVQPIPLPYQINPAVWDSMGSVGQQLALSAAEAAGWDKDEYLRQINAARPQGTAPGASSTTFRTPMGAFS